MPIQQTPPMSSDFARVPSRPIVSPSVPVPEGGRQELQANGKVLPTGDTQPEPKVINRDELAASVSRLNDHARAINRDLKFTVDEDINKVIVRVYNAETDELIRQIPSEEALAMARHLARDEGIIVDTEV